MRPLSRAVLALAVLTIGSAVLLAQKNTVWDGVYTVPQASRGAAAYRTNCAGCHGPDLAGDGMAPSLVGEGFFFQWSDTTLNDLFRRITTGMPPDKPGSLAPEVYRDIVAFLLEANKIPAGQAELTPEADHLKEIAITAAPR